MSRLNSTREEDGPSAREGIGAAKRVATSRAGKEKALNTTSVRECIMPDPVRFGGEDPGKVARFRRGSPYIFDCKDGVALFKQERRWKRSGLFARSSQPPPR